MSNDENKSLQQSLPLSWEEDSQNNLEEQAPPKKLLLRREESEDDNVEQIVAPKPLLLKKAEEVEYREQLDNLDTIYDKEIPTEDDTSFEDEEIEETFEEDFEEETFEENAELNDDLQEDLEDEEIEETFEEDFEEETFEENAELNDDLQEDLEDENDSYESAFEDSGTFTLDDKVEEDSSFQEDEIEESRIEIPAESLSDLDSNAEMEDTEATQDSPLPSDEPKESKEVESITEEESVFALKADTYYEVQTEEKSTEENAEPVDESASEVVQHFEVKTLGALLQEARLSCSFTIKDAAEATRIKSSYIIALENNEMEELPAKVYVLNYIRQLCREYNVPNEPIIEAFERQNDSNNSNGDIKIMRVGDEEARKATKPNSKLNALVVGTSLLTITMLFLIGWYMKWFNPTSSPENIKVDVNLEEVRPEVKLPAPELPIPNQ